MRRFNATLSNRLFEIFEHFSNIGTLAFYEGGAQSRLIVIERVRKIWRTLTFAHDFVSAYMKQGIAETSPLGVEFKPHLPHLINPRA
jgi:hypothetical protein